MSDHMPLSCVLTIQQRIVAGLSEPSMAKHSGMRPLYKARWDKADLVGYYFESGNLLQAQFVPSHLLSCGIGCQHSDHLLLINRYYENLINCLKIASPGTSRRSQLLALKNFGTKI